MADALTWPLMPLPVCGYVDGISFLLMSNRLVYVLLDVNTGLLPPRRRDVGRHVLFLFITKWLTRRGVTLRGFHNGSIC
jgi:hypothetical protein